MKPGDHPEFFRLAPPPGTSRESAIRLDHDGQFWMEGDRIEHPALHAALTRWITRHPDDGRFILCNGYDWTYFWVDDAPYVVRSLSVEATRVVLTLSDETQETLDPSRCRVGDASALYVAVKGGQFEARFSRHAQNQLAPVLVEDAEGTPAIEIAGVRHTIGTR
jgi:uncharacterized protein